MVNSICGRVTVCEVCLLEIETVTDLRLSTYTAVRRR